MGAMGIASQRTTDHGIKNAIRSWYGCYVTIHQYSSTISWLKDLKTSPSWRRSALNLMPFSTKCPVFDGSGDIHIEDFLEDVIQYCNDTRRSPHQEMLQCLLYHLQGEAKSFSRIIQNKTWHNVITQLRHHYGYFQTEKLKLRASLFQYEQAAKETCQKFAIRLQQEARLSDLKEEDLVNIAIYGTHSNIPTSRPTCRWPNPRTFRNFWSYQ